MYRWLGLGSHYTIDLPFYVRLQMSNERTFRPTRDISAHDLHMEGRSDLDMLQERLHLGLSLLENSESVVVPEVDADDPLKNDLAGW